MSHVLVYRVQGSAVVYCPGLSLKKFNDILEYDVNTFSKRALSDGHRYNGYFKDSSCTPSFLGTNDTAFTVAQMKKWATKNTAQVMELALNEFSGKSITATATAIYEFLYHHFQYELDGKEQRLKSPACAWATRYDGMDCKSYSIFTSALLINLGIKHYFRRVKQPGAYPEQWTHVYVIIPLEQKNPPRANPKDYVIIDATRHENTEGSFTKNTDTLMSKVRLRHIGLQGPSIGLGGCQCTPKVTSVPLEIIPIPVTAEVTRTITGSRSNTAAPVVTVNPTTTESTAISRENSRSTSTSRSYFNADTSGEQANRALAGLAELQKPYGLKSSLSQIATSLGTTVSNDQSKSSNITSSGSNTANWTNLAATAIAAGATGAQQNQVLTEQGTRQMRLDAINQSGATSATIKAIGGAAAAYTWGISALLMLVPNEWYEKALGQWFKDGFKCWGASWTPTKAKEVANIENDFLKNDAMVITQLVSTGTVEEIESAINTFMEYFYSIQSTSRAWLESGNSKDCTEDGLKLLIKTLDEGKKEYQGIFKSMINQAGHALVENGTKTVTYPPQEHTGRYSLVQEVEQYRIQINPAVFQAQSAAQNTLVGTNESTVQTAGFSTTGILILAAIAGGTYLYRSS